MRTRLPLRRGVRDDPAVRVDHDESVGSRGIHFVHHPAQLLQVQSHRGDAGDPTTPPNRRRHRNRRAPIGPAEYDVERRARRGGHRVLEPLPITQPHPDVRRALRIDPRGKRDRGACVIRDGKDVECQLSPSGVLHRLLQDRRLPQ